MAEKHGFQAPEGHRLCANDCGFLGSPATQNFCSKCYRDLRLNEEAESKAKPVMDSLFTLNSSPSSSSSSAPTTALLKPDSSTVAEAVDAEPAGLVPQAAVQPVEQPNRCSVCRRKVGLTGFRCRCGITFCGTHRYPEQHGCSFDFKSMGREAIAKANPLIKGQKLEKI